MQRKDTVVIFVPTMPSVEIVACRNDSWNSSCRSDWTSNNACDRENTPSDQWGDGRWMTKVCRSRSRMMLADGFFSETSESNVRSAVDPCRRRWERSGRHDRRTSRSSSDEIASRWTRGWRSCETDCCRRHSRASWEISLLVWRSMSTKQ